MNSVEPHYYRFFRVTLLALIMFCTTASALQAQGQTRDRDDHRGTDFRIAFLHTDGDGDYPTYYLVISSEKKTKGTITYESDGTTVDVPILVPNEAVRIRLDTFKLLMPPPVGKFKESGDTAISRRTLHVQFDDEVTLYAINTLRWSSDGFVALPKEAIGTDYTILSYPNTRDPATLERRFSDFPSQFAVIAHEDNTQVTITPTVPVNARGNINTFIVTLNAGEVFFGQAINRRRNDVGGSLEINTGEDLTGTKIVASKPVVVYGSHQRTNIPFDDAVGRDHLVEQLPPTDKWGTRAMITPHFQIPKTVNDANFAEVIAAENGTILTIDSTNQIVLSAGRPERIPLNRAKLLTANKKILVAQYHHSTVETEFYTNPNDTIGDPFMMLVPAREQFDTNYTFESWDTKDFIYHYVNIVIPRERISTLRIDDKLLNDVDPKATWTEIPKSSYSYTQVELRPGSHNVTARVPFGLYMYGYGPFNSYGMPGGMVFDSIFKDHEEPEITVWDTCGGLAGVAFDSDSLDFGIESVRLLPNSSNVRLDLDPFEPGADSVFFKLQVIDPYRDGIAEMIAVDTAGLERRYRFQVKGFTVQLTEGPPVVTLDTLSSLNGMEFCRTYTMKNTGNGVQTVNQIILRDQIPGVRVNAPLPVTLNPGQSRSFQICYQHVGDTSAVIEISIDNGCLVKPLALLPIYSGLDTIPPDTTRLTQYCERDVIYEITELYATNSGIADVIVRTRINADIVIPSSTQLPGRRARVEILRQSIWEDVVYDIEVIDVVGNRVRLTDTLAGLTLSMIHPDDFSPFGFRPSPAVPWIFDSLVYTEQDCDTIILRNTGLKTLDLRRIRFMGNLHFSFPPEQMPILLAPGEETTLEVCVLPPGAGSFRDTMVIDFFCNELIALAEYRSSAKRLVGDGSDRCGNLIELSIGGNAKQNFLDLPIPNPVQKGIVALTVGLTEEESVTLVLFDGMGNEVRRFLDNDPMPGGISRIQAELGDLPSGQYFVHMATDNEKFTRRLILQQ